MKEKLNKKSLDTLLESYLSILKSENIINRFEIVKIEGTPIIIITCYFDYKEDLIKKTSSRRGARRELYCKIILSVEKNFQFESHYFFIESEPDFDWFRGIVIRKMKDRSYGEFTENRAVELMRQLKSEGDCGIIHIYKGSDYADNKLKLDIILVVEKKMPKVFFDERNERFTIGFNVKSSFGGQAKHKNKNYFAPSLCMDKSLSDEQIKVNAKDLILNSLIFLHSRFTGALISDASGYSFEQSLSYIIGKSKNNLHK